MNLEDEDNDEVVPSINIEIDDRLTSNMVSNMGRG
jgi:hypothetical protein